MLVTGGAGYVGSLVVGRLLAVGHRVRVLDRLIFTDRGLAGWLDQIELVEADIRDCDPAVCDDIDAVLHLAAVATDRTAQVNPRLTDLVNHIATARLARIARRRGVRRFIFASTCSVYAGFTGAEQPPLSREDDPIDPVAVYAVSKRAAEEAVLVESDRGFAVVVLRNGTLYGDSPRMRYDLVMNTFVRDSCRAGVITVDCNGDIWRPLMDVGDLASICLRAMTLPVEVVGGQIFNAVSYNVRIGDLAERVRTVLERDRGAAIQVALRSQGLARSYCADGSKLRAVFGYVPSRDLDRPIVALWDRLPREPGRLDDPIFSNDLWHRTLLETEDARALSLDLRPARVSA